MTSLDEFLAINEFYIQCRRDLDGSFCESVCGDNCNTVDRSMLMWQTGILLDPRCPDLRTRAVTFHLECPLLLANNPLRGYDIDPAVVARLSDLCPPALDLPEFSDELFEVVWVDALQSGDCFRHSQSTFSSCWRCISGE